MSSRRPVAAALVALGLLAFAFPAAAEPSPAASTPAGSPAPTGPPPYQDPQDRFAIAFPARWTVGPDPTNAAITSAVGPSGLAIKLVAARLAGGNTLESYVSGSLAAWSAIWKVREQGAAKLGPLEARRLVIDQTIGRQTTRLLKYFAADGAAIYVFTAYASPAVFAVQVPLFEAIAATFVPGAWAASTPAPGAAP